MRLHICFFTCSAASGTFFVLYEINMVFLTCVLPQENASWKSAVFWTHLLREVCTIVNGVGILAFAFMSTDWDKYRLYIAIVEW